MGRRRGRPRRAPASGRFEPLARGRRRSMISTGREWPEWVVSGHSQFARPRMPTLEKRTFTDRREGSRRGGVWRSLGLACCEAEPGEQQLLVLGPTPNRNPRLQGSAKTVKRADDLARFPQLAHMGVAGHQEAVRSQ
jgi:hypothetical protein